MPATIAPQLYVTIQYRGDANNESGLLGFASPYTRDAAFKKRKATQDSWAYGSGIEVAIDDEDSVTVTGEGGGRGNFWDPAALFIANCYPRIINNEPLEGFQIAKTVRRSGWSGSGNVVWRISDPRGFDLEITSENFASVVNCADLEKGVIKGRCVWGRDGARNVLLPESSEPYQAAMTQTRKVNSRVSLRDVKPGDCIEILSSRVADEDQVCEFLGRYFFLQPSAQPDTRDDADYSDLGVWNLAQNQTERYLIRGKATGRLYAMPSLKVTGIIEAAEEPLDRSEVARFISDGLREQQHIDGELNTILISPSRIDAAGVKVEAVPYQFNYSPSDQAWPRCGSGYRRQLVLAKNQMGTWLCGYYTQYVQGRSAHVPVAVDLDTDHKTLTFQYTFKEHTRFFGRSRIREHVTLDNVQGLEFFDIRISYNGITGSLCSLH